MANDDGAKHESAVRRSHPIFNRIIATEDPQPTGVVEALVERRVRQARADGYFDNLAGAGKPIADIDQQRPAGWWANRLVTEERNKLKALQLDDEISAAMPGVWRLDTEANVRARVAELNERVAAHNVAVRNTAAPRALLDADATVATWRRLTGTQ